MPASTHVMPVPPFLAAITAIEEKHKQLGDDAGFLGAAIEDMGATPDGIGFFRRFTNGMIYFTPSTGAQEIHGAILEKWASLGFERSFLGYPVHDERETPDGVGRFNRFQGGMIYWTPGTGAHEIHGAILTRWSELGFERSFLGYPTTDETEDVESLGRFNRFQGGMIYWFPVSGAQEIREQLTVRQIVEQKISEKYNEIGRSRSPLGLPHDPQMLAVKSGQRFVTNFRGGHIEFPDDGAGAVAIKQFRVEVWWVGLECQVRQEKVDEVYGSIAAIIPGSGMSMTHKFPGDRDSWDMGPDGQRVVNVGVLAYNGPPMDLLIITSLIEHDSGDIEQYKQKFAEIISKTARGLAEMEGIPAEALAADQGFLNDLSLGLVNSISSVLGADDDAYNPGQLILHWPDILGHKFTRQTLRRNDDPRTVDFTHSIVVSGTDDGGDTGHYAFYFDVRLFEERTVI